MQRPSIHIHPKVQRLNPLSNPQREFRAKQTHKHNQVDRFGAPAAPAVQTITGEIIQRNAPGVPRAQTPGSPAAAVMPSMVSSASHQRLERMLDEALTRADSHKQALRYHAARHFWQRPGFLGRRTVFKLILIVIAVVAATGFVAWQKFPQLSVKLAGSRAHITASMPSYKPEGYKLAAPASAANGAVLIKYTAGQDDQSYEISQKQSDLTSTSLAQTVVPAGAQVQTTQVAGNTVYIYGLHNDAAWVNNGVLYTINNRAELSSDQIIKIVEGLN
jgi:hypothetical protein